MSTLISFKKCKSLEIKSLLTSLLRQGDTMEMVLNEILPQWFLTDTITTSQRILYWQGRHRYKTRARIKTESDRPRFYNGCKYITYIYPIWWPDNPYNQVQANNILILGKLKELFTALSLSLTAGCHLYIHKKNWNFFYNSPYL